MRHCDALRDTVRKENEGMKFGDFVSREAIRANLAAEDKEGAIREMIGALLGSR